MRLWTAVLSLRDSNRRQTIGLLGNAPPPGIRPAKGISNISEVRRTTAAVITRRAAPASPASPYPGPRSKPQFVSVCAACAMCASSKGATSWD